jgi:3-deoxy-D-manno-octulosonate 8-phosphate phosphatase (KDO 8-P phosphatase)
MENGDVLMKDGDSRQRAQRIKMIIMDVDGTLTDGSLLLLPDGEELKSYNVLDGLGILLAHLAGLKTGIITGKTSQPLSIRAERLNITEIHQGILDKDRVLETILEKHRLLAEEVAYIGDDLGDLEVIKKVGFAGAVANAHPFIKEGSHFHCQKEGGRGAVREFIEFILTAQDKWGIIQENIASIKGPPPAVPGEKEQ